MASVGGRVVGRYVLYDEIASGGMASVYFGRMTGAVGFKRTVAVKRLHPHLASDPDFVAMILDEARLAARIVHPNVVQTLDVVTDGKHSEIFIVMEYVQGESLSKLQRALFQRGELASVPTTTTIMAAVLHGLHAAHEAKDERGQPLGIVHRDVSPQNVMVGADGSVRLLDFGVAKAAGRVQSTREGSVKGKIAYMAPEQIRGVDVDRRTDVYAASVVLWELLTGRRLFEAENDAVLVHRITQPSPIDPPSLYNPTVSPALDALVLRGLAHQSSARFATAREMAQALERVAPMVPGSQIGEWTERLAGGTLARRAQLIAAIEQQPDPAPKSGPSLFASTLPLEHAARLPDHAATLRDAPELGTHAGTSRNHPLPAKRSRVALFSVLGTLACVAVVAVVWLVRKPEVTLTATAPVATPAALATATAPTTPELPPTPKAAEPAAPPAASAAVAAAPADKPKPTKAAGRRVSCDPPYTVDASGIKTYKRECLK